ncbi:MAG: PfkB family carbohydrate kinase [Nitrospiraceae bacterium]|nr:PfkB family carbohydrate kinase [Nitrospiraceae bacterium]
MIESVGHKILPLHELIARLGELRAQGRTIVQSHGVFDLIHPGIINHLEKAKRQGDVLVVTVIKDKDVRRGPGRPVFPDAMRVENVAALQLVDFACAVDDEIPFECVKMIAPDVFAKGQAYKERHRKIHEKIFEEERELYFGKSRIFETDGFSFSSSQIVNNFLDIYPEDTKSFLKDFSMRYTFSGIAETLNSLKDLKVLLIGDGIIDEYHYCAAMGKSAKSHLVVSKYLTHEVFYGGAFAIANHIAGLCEDVQLVTLLGSENSSRDREIAKGLKQNVKAKFFYRDDGPTIVKKRYIDQYLNQKIFEVNYLNDEFIGGEREAEILAYIEKTAGLFDIVLVSDFGHGFVTPGIIGAIEKNAKRYAVTTQTNAANAGYNMITKYRRPYYVCLDEPEIRLAAQERFSNIQDVALAIKRRVNADYLMVTLGKKGSFGIDQRDTMNNTPVFSSKVIDTIGAGDAFFAFTAPCFARELPLDLASFIGNAVGALAVQIVGNKKAVEKYELLAFIDAILK